MKTIRDIAQAANVSITTVSRVFNGSKGISAATCDRVLAIAKEMDYSPNRSAVQLVSRREDTVGVLLSHFGKEMSRDEYLIGLISGIYNEAERQENHVSMFSADSILKSNQNYVQFCRANNLIGLIIHGLQLDDAHIEHLLASEVPCVFIDMFLSGDKVTSVSIDNITAAREVTEKLLGLGHRHIVYVGGSEKAAVNLHRLEGYRQAMDSCPETTAAALSCDFSAELASKQVRSYLLDHPDATAFFCASDIMAAAALGACMDLGYKVPEDISIVGFDDLTMTKLIRPTLSTVDQNFFGMGAAATKLLLDLSEGKDVPPHCEVPHKIKFRESVAKRKNV